MSCIVVALAKARASCLTFVSLWASSLLCIGDLTEVLLLPEALLSTSVTDGEEPLKTSDNTSLKGAKA
jgi:hypothetical protein